MQKQRRWTTQRVTEETRGRLLTAATRAGCSIDELIATLLCEFESAAESYELGLGTSERPYVKCLLDMREARRTVDAAIAKAVGE